MEVANMISMQGVMGESGGSPLCYVALAEALEELGRHAASKGATVHMPRIGSGLAGGDWDRIEKLILTMMVKHKIMCSFTYGKLMATAVGARAAGMQRRYWPMQRLQP